MPEPREGEPLTEREVLFLQWLADGMTYVQVSHRSLLHTNTVHKISKRIRIKLGAATLAHAVHIADRRGLIEP